MRYVTVRPTTVSASVRSLFETSKAGNEAAAAGRSSVEHSLHAVGDQIHADHQRLAIAPAANTTVHHAPPAISVYDSDSARPQSAEGG